MRSPGYLLFPALLLCSVVSSAQDVREAYNFSNLTVQGTASSMGYGNALGSLGGDFSSVSVNPAGLAIYRSSELSITPSLRMNGVSSDYAGTNTADNNTHFNFNSFSLIFTSAAKGKRYEHRNWKAVSFALGMNRVADFNRNYTYQGNNNTSSASQAFESDANLNPGAATSATANSLGNMGYYSFLLNQDPTSGSFYTTVPFAGGISQLKSVQENGCIDEYTISLGGNYKEKLMLGVTIGIPYVNYHSTSNYTETSSDNNAVTNPFGFNSFNYNQNLDITGGGINAKIGAIYKITDFFRIGAAFHSPTFYSLSDVSKTSLYVNNDSTIAAANSGGYTGIYSRNEFDYYLTTPWKGILSATFILKNLGFITADYEYVDYSSMRYRYSDGMDYTTGNSYQSEENAINQEIKKTYKGASDFRLGAGFNVTKIFVVRVGAGYYGNAYTAYGEANQLYYTTQRIDLNAGLGLHFKHFYTDLGFVHSMYQGVEQPYSIDYSGVVSGTQATIPQAKTNYSINNLALTMGVRF